MRTPALSISAALRAVMVAALVLAAPLSLGGCQTVSAALTTRDNPVGAREIAALHLSYQAAGEVVRAYNAYCYSAQTPPPGCANRGPVMRRIKTLDAQAYAALSALDKFVRENPRLNAITAFTAARSAVTSYRSAVADAQAASTAR